MRHIGKNKTFPDCIKTHIVVNNKTYKIVVYLRKNRSAKSLSNTEYGYEYFTFPTDGNIDLNKASGLVEFWYKNEGKEVFIPKHKLCDKKLEKSLTNLVTDIKDEESQVLELTGGKGNSLALLSTLRSTSFTVPDGFIVTTKANRLHILNNAVLFDLLFKQLPDICHGITDGDLKDICDKVVDIFKNGTIHSEVGKTIMDQLKKYPVDSEFLGWAVRSSAVGEDSEDLSAAGQNETFLGCQNEDILKNVLACWASLYTYQSVQYRRQHGLPICSEMAVVVQKMVKADSAGVLFTCHPSTSNPAEMIITSNFGLGETVVSGESDPDTIILNRTWDGNVGVKEKTLGSKNKVVRATSEGLAETIGDQSIQQTWSLTDEQAVTLGQVGVQLEQAFGNHRDIEWAFCEDKLFLLQSRPITTLNGWSDFELSHEMDTPLRTKATYFTTANIREVIPKAVTVLSHSTSVRCGDWSIQRFAQQNFDPLSEKGFITYQHNMLLDVITSIHRNVEKEIHASGLILDLAIFGHAVLDEKIHAIAKNRSGIASKSKQLYDVSRIMVNAWFDLVGTSKKLVDNLTSNGIRDEDDAEDIYRKIDDSLDDVGEVAHLHAKTSAVSVFFQIIAMNIMLEGKSALTSEHMSDFASILSSCKDVISAEVPKYLENMANIIKQDEYTEQFSKLDPSEGVAFLKNQCHRAYELFCEFMDKHGHRSFQEFEMSELSWRENPTLIISMLQANVKSKTIISKESVSIEDVVKSLKSPEKRSTKTVIKFLIKRIRVAVGCREQTKSEMIRAYDKLRQAYRRLGQQMVQEGLLPSKDLTYHLTHEELGSLVSDNNPALVTKAIRRQKMFPQWKKLEFPELMPEVPKAEDTSTPVESLTGVCKGTPVCTGIVQARACVIRSLDEIDQLRIGDILITYSTDIGWSPYFPMLTGIVTELGGLVSHGAVVAREYGLPCIVGVQNVTKYFKTGDNVQLNATKGELGKI